MITAVNNGKKVIAISSKKKEKPFFCPACGEEVILKKGRVRIHHFAHWKNSSCFYGQGETELHRVVKTNLYNAMLISPEYKQVELEKNLKIAIPDIFCMIKGVKIAIEIQKTSLSQNELIRRTVRYTNMGIAVLWIIPVDKFGLHFLMNEYEYKVKEQEKFLHSLYFGHIYFYSVKDNNDSVRIFHFDDVKRYVEGYYGYNSDGEYVEIDGYYKRLKTTKKPNYFGEDRICNFGLKNRDKWNDIPQSMIWIDRNKKWWE